jgi:hypothetical protein
VPAASFDASVLSAASVAAGVFVSAASVTTAESLSSKIVDDGTSWVLYSRREACEFLTCRDAADVAIGH